MDNTRYCMWCGDSDPGVDARKHGRGICGRTCGECGANTPAELHRQGCPSLARSDRRARDLAWEAKRKSPDDTP